MPLDLQSQLRQQRRAVLLAWRLPAAAVAMAQQMRAQSLLLSHSCHSKLTQTTSSSRASTSSSRVRSAQAATAAPP
jgi:hypothetical protein